MMKRVFVYAGLLTLLYSCDFFTPEPPVSEPVEEEELIPVDEPMVTVSFTPAEGTVINPDRGLYSPKDFFSKTSALKGSEVKAARLKGMTLWYLGFYLTDFLKGDISETFLTKIQQSMDALREGGGKCILRFAYSDGYTEGTSMAKEDPEVSIALRHVEQLKPILQKNEDVIYVMQAGFVGTWGEWYYTGHFNFQPSTDADFQPRKQLTESLLAALPTSRQVALRTPQFKMRMFGLTVKDTITARTAHDGSNLSRLAGHNDCFGAAADDWGTFDNETRDRDFWKADSRYTIMGGETCNVSDYCTCKASLNDVKDYHWSYLNSGYNTDVLNRWKTSGCYEEIVNRLGYRIVLKKLERSEQISEGNTCWVKIELENTGFAAPMNPRDAIFVWETPDGKTEEKVLSEDPRTWHPGVHVFSASFKPSTAKGTLYLKLSDPLLRDRPDYSIALANENVFNSKTGMNKLFEIK